MIYIYIAPKSRGESGRIGGVTDSYRRTDKADLKQNVFKRFLNVDNECDWRTSSGITDNRSALKCAL